MTTEDQIIAHLSHIAVTHKPKSVWIVKYGGQHLTMPSGKSSWSSIGATKNALRNALYSIGRWQERLDTIKGLEERGIITYEQIF